MNHEHQSMILKNQLEFTKFHNVLLKCWLTVEAILPNCLLKTMMVEEKINICVHEMCCTEKCGAKQHNSTLKTYLNFINFFGICAKNDSSTPNDSGTPRKIRVPQRIVRENFKKRVQEIFDKKKQKDQVNQPRF